MCGDGLHGKVLVESNGNGWVRDQAAYMDHLKWEEAKKDNTERRITRANWRGICGQTKRQGFGRETGRREIRRER